MADHRARYKNTGLDSKELRRRREEDSVQLRKQKRDDVLSKRRTLAPTCEDMFDEDDSIEVTDSITKELISALKQNEDQQLLIENAQKVRKILSKEPQPPFDDVIQSGLIPRFVELLDSSDPTIQFEVAWILTNICSGTSEQTRAVVDNNAVPKLVSLLASTDMKVCEQAVWALGNIIGDGAQFRDLVIQYGFVPALLALIRPDVEIGFLRNETWVLVNLCRNKDPPPSYGVIHQLIPALNYLIQSTDLAILIDTTWAVSYITELGPDYSQLIIDSGLVNRMTPLLSNDEIKIQTAAIRALGTVVTGNDAQTQAVIDAGALPHIRRILERSKDRVVKEALWFISNVAAGSSNQIQAIIDNKLIPLINRHLSSGDFHQQKEAVWIYYNMSLSGSPDQAQILVNEQSIHPLCDMLNVKHNEILRNVLETLTAVLNNCKDDSVQRAIEECDGLEKIEALQSNPNQDIYTYAYDIIDKYFNDDEPQ